MIQKSIILLSISLLTVISLFAQDEKTTRKLSAPTREALIRKADDAALREVIQSFLQAAVDFANENEIPHNLARTQSLEAYELFPLWLGTVERSQNYYLAAKVNLPDGRQTQLLIMGQENGTAEILEAVETGLQIIIDFEKRTVTPKYDTLKDESFRTNPGSELVIWTRESNLGRIRTFANENPRFRLDENPITITIGDNVSIKLYLGITSLLEDVPQQGNIETTGNDGAVKQHAEPDDFHELIWSLWSYFPVPDKFSPHGLGFEIYRPIDMVPKDDSAPGSEDRGKREPRRMRNTPNPFENKMNEARDQESVQHGS